MLWGVDTYCTDSTTKHFTRRKGIYDCDGPFNPGHDFAIVSSEVTESLCLFLKDIDDGVGGSASCEPGNDWILSQAGPRSLLELVQGSFEEGFQLWRGIDGHGVEGGEVEQKHRFSS